MKLCEIRDILQADVLCGEELLDAEVCGAFAGDYMSDVLATARDQMVLLTGLVNPQVVRTAEMLDMKCVVFVRGKLPEEPTVALARERGIVLLSTAMRMYPACGELYSRGLMGE